MLRLDSCESNGWTVQAYAEDEEDGEDEIHSCM